MFTNYSLGHASCNSSIVHAHTYLWLVGVLGELVVEDVLIHPYGELVLEADPGVSGEPMEAGVPIPCGGMFAPRFARN